MQCFENIYISLQRKNVEMV